MIENVTKVSVQETEEGIFKVGIKVKDISPDLIEEAIKIRNEHDLFKVSYESLTDNEDKIFVYLISILCPQNEIDKAITALKWFIFWTLKLACKYKIYKDEIYQHFYYKILDEY